MGLYKSFLAKGRKLSTEILIVFLFLIGVSSSTLIVFSDFKYTHLIGNLARGTIDRVSVLIINRIECMLNDLAIQPKSVSSYYQRHPEQDIPNETLLYFLLAGLKNHPHLYSYYIGSVNGSAIITFNLNITGHSPFFGDSSKPFPAGSAFAAILVDRNQNPPVETWNYYDQNLILLSSNKVPFRGYDPRQRPWYTGAKETGKLFWTDIFVYDPTGDSGIAVSVPIFSETNELQSVVGADLPLNLFSHFLTDQKVGKAGDAYILDASGKIIIPYGKEKEKIDDRVVSEAYSLYAKEKKTDFSFKLDNVEYLASIYSFPSTFDKNWLILIIDPFSDYFSYVTHTEHQVIWISLAILIFSAILVAFLAKHISAPIVILANEVDKITRLELESDKRVESDIKEIMLMDSSIADLRSAIRSFSRYAPKEVVKELMTKRKEIVLGGEKKEITILFTDIVEFTPIAESLPIETVISLLAEYFDLLSRIILDYQGTIDKYIGDSIMAFWGAPQEKPDQASLACTTALLCQAELTKLNQSRERKQLPPFLTRIGINTGSVIVGNIGTSERMNYSVIGDAVNAASRMQLLNKTYHTKIVIGGDVQAKIGNEFLVRPLDEVEVKGKKKKVKIYELVAKKEGIPALLPTPEQVELCALFTKAYEAYHTGQHAEGRRQFEAIHHRFPNDYPTQYYLKLNLSSNS